MPALDAESIPETVFPSLSIAVYLNLCAIVSPYSV